jgi:hypothetical protein
MLAMPLRKRVMVGTLGGLLAAVLFSAWATVGRVTMGAVRYERDNGPWLQAVLIFFALLPLSGALVGLLFQIYRRAWGATLLGFIVVFPLILAFGLMGSMRGLPLGVKIAGSALFSLIAGGGVGLQSWSVDRQKGNLDQTDTRSPK